MPASIIDSHIFRDIFATEAMRRVWSDESRTAHYLAIERALAVVRDALRPTAAEADWARRVMDATASGAGAVQVDGRMVDRPVVLKARDILARAQR